MGRTPRPPALRRRRLGAALRRLRVQLQLDRDEAGELANFSGSKVTRIENGEVGVSRNDLEKLLDVYGVTLEADREAERSELIELSRRSREPNWWSAYDLPSTYVRLIELERDAEEICTYQQAIVPGLLQTRDYARAIITACRPDHEPDEIERKVEVRMHRQGIFDSAGVECWVILDEAVLHRLVGGPKVMRDQLLHLANLVDERRVRLQVLPFDVGCHEAIMGSFMLLRFGDDDPDLVFAEGPFGDIYLDQERDVNRCSVMFAHLCADASRQAESIDLLRTRAVGLA